MAFFEKEYSVDVSHVAPNGFITNMGILSLLEDTACKHSDVAGYGFYGFNDIQNTGLSWILLAWKVKVLKRVKYADVVKVRTWARPSKKFTTLRDFEMLDKNGNVICIATTKWTLVDIKKETITVITDEIINKYFPEDRSMFSENDIAKLIEPKEYSSEYIYKTQRRDIDINKHMHNLNYLYLAYEALPEDVYNSPECDNVEIMYKTSIRLGDTVKCMYSKIDDSQKFYILFYRDK